MTDFLKLNSVEDSVSTLGPGPAAAIWVQGCPIGCRGCISPHTWRRDQGVVADVRDVARWLIGSGRERLTISGGEPMEQAPALSRLIDAIRQERDWLVTVYSGYRIENLRAGGPAGSADLLARADLLIDGPYSAAQHAPLLWRGSRNQRIHNLTCRVELPADEPAGVTPKISSIGDVTFIGVFPEAGMFDRIRDAFALDADSDLSIPDPHTFPFPVKPNPENPAKEA